MTAFIGLSVMPVFQTGDRMNAQELLVASDYLDEGGFDEAAKVLRHVADTLRHMQERPKTIMLEPDELLVASRLAGMLGLSVAERELIAASDAYFSPRRRGGSPPPPRPTRDYVF